MRGLYVYLGALLLWGGCNTAASLPDEVQPFFPSSPLLQEGVAQKYYFHYQENGTDKVATSINYLVYRLRADGQLEMKEYTADFSPVRYRLFRFDEEQMLLERYQRYVRQDTFEQAILQSPFRHFGQDSSLSVTQTEAGTVVKTQQTTVQDTVRRNRATKCIKGYSFTQSEETGNVSNLITFEEYYAAGLGLYERYSANDQSNIKVELVEQLSLAAFRQMQDHGKHRVAYINPDSTLRYRPDFQLCNATADIIDYYNPEPDVAYRGGKQALWKIIRPKLNPDLLNGISGYLTFRFVVNCKGETGRFVFVPTSLDFQPVNVPAAAVDHLGGITAELDDWVSGVYQDQPKDAYVYLTYKLQDGEVVELLP